MLKEYVIIISVLSFLLLLAVIFLYGMYKTLEALNEGYDEISEELKDTEEKLRLETNKYQREGYHFRNLRKSITELVESESSKKNASTTLSKREMYARLLKLIEKSTK